MSACHGEAPVLTSDRSGAPTTRVLLIGNPNVGKSTLFNALTGSRQRVTNAPGTTVDLQTGTWRTSAGDVEIVDLPGTYSLIARSPDEAVVAAAVAAAGPSGAHRELTVVVLDATAPARSLYLLAQVAADGRPVVVALTMSDVARGHGAAVDAVALEHLLAAPVVELDPRGAAGLAALEQVVVQGLARPVRGLPAPRPAPDGERPARPDARTDVVAQLAEAERLFGWVEEVTAAVATRPTVRRTRTDTVDAVLLNPWVGVPALLTTLWALFQLTTAIAAPLMALVSTTVQGPLAEVSHRLLAGWAPAWLDGLLVDGVLAGVGTVAAFIPLMALMHTALALLEDSGYLARAAFLADRGMRSLGLDGRAMLPLVMGFGCNLPALAATRTIPHARQRLLTGLLVPWTSCAARLTVYVLLAATFFPDHAGTVVLALYVTSSLLVVTGGLVLRRTLFRDLERDAFLLVLPAYQRPQLGAILGTVRSRVAGFAVKAGRVIVATLVVVWVLMSVPLASTAPLGDVPVQESVYGRVAAGVAPVFGPAGFGDWHLTASLATGFVAKEVVVGALAQAYAIPQGTSGTTGTDDAPLAAALRSTFTASSGGHPQAAALAFLVFVLGYTPCLATVAEQRRLFGLRWTAGAVGVQLTVAWLLAVGVFQVGRLL